MKNYVNKIFDTIITFVKKSFSTFLSDSTISQSASHDSQSKTICITYKKLNWVVSGLVVFGIMNFVAGYFWGQRKAVEYFIKRIEEDSFADRISYALYTMNDRDSLEFEDSDAGDSTENEVESSDATDASDVSENTDSEDDMETELDQQVDSTTTTTKEEIKEQIDTKDKNQNKTTNLTEQSKQITAPKHIYFARLAGFGSIKPAKEFLERILLFDSKASIAERTSKTARGKKVVWYQVITSQFDDKKDLDRIVGYIKNKEHINGVQIVDQMQDVTATQKKG